MKKIIVSIMTALILCMMTACSNGSSGAITPEAFEISGPEIIPTGAVVEYSCRIDFSEDADLSAIDNFLSNFELIWSSSDENIAQVDKNGKITAINEGETVITVKTEDESVSAQFNILVKPKYDIKTTNEVIFVGDIISFDITQTTVGGQGTVEFPYEGLSFSIKDDGILITNEAGELQAHSAGKTEIVITDISGNKYPAEIEVVLKGNDSLSDKNADDAIVSKDSTGELETENPIEIPDEEIAADDTTDTSESEALEENIEVNVAEGINDPKMNIIILPLIEEPVVENIPGNKTDVTAEPIKNTNI